MNSHQPYTSYNQDILGIYHKNIQITDIAFLIAISFSIVGIIIIILQGVHPAFVIFLSILCIVLARILFVNIRDIYARASLRIIVHQNSIIEQRNKSIHTFSWEDIAYIWDYGFPTGYGTAYTLCIQNKNNHILSLNDMISNNNETYHRPHTKKFDLLDLREHIIKNVTPLLINQAITKYQNEQPIDLLVFSFSPVGLFLQKEWRSWSDIRNIDQVDNNLLITFNNPKYDSISIKYTSIPNIDIFIELLHRYHKDKYTISHQYNPF